MFKQYDVQAVRCSSSTMFKQYDEVWFSTFWGPRKILILAVDDSEHQVSYLVEFVHDDLGTGKGPPFTISHNEWSLSKEKP